MLAADTPTRLRFAVLRVSEQAIKFEPPSNWAEMDEHALWCELVSCILGSKVSFEHAQAATGHLDDIGLLDITNTASIPRDLEASIAHALSKPIYPPLTRLGTGRRYRYSCLRANHIRRSAQSIYVQGNSIQQVLTRSGDARAARSVIIATAFGIGPKQASLFLRNIGYADDLAILDSHVLRYMALQAFISKTLQAVSHLATYERIETRLQRYAKDIQVKMSCLDRAIWVVMRVFQQEFAR